MTTPRPVLLSLLSVALAATASAKAADKPPTRDEARAALLKAVRFYHGEVASRGGYLWRYSADLSLREGEGKAGRETVWVQPPGTPAVGEALLDAYEATGEAACLDAARDAGHALALGQLHSGGWAYRIEFAPAERRAFSYRFDLDGRPLPDPTTPADRTAGAGWDEWKRRRFKGNVSTLDDDTTQAAVRFLVRLDKTLGFKDERVHRAAEYGLNSLLGAQYPNGGWSANFDRFPETPPDAKQYPPKPAAYPDDWPRAWPKDFTGCYVTNDNLMADAVATTLLAHQVYGDPRALAAAERAGAFLLLAQMPDPQPAWAQQYDRDMRPAWSRAFEPPAVTGGESQGVMRTLMALYRQTGNDKYLKPIPSAVAYLRRSRLPDGRLARFYELKTNRPLYFVRVPNAPHQMTYESKGMATHYAFIVNSDLDAIEAEYNRLRQGAPPPRDATPRKPRPTPGLAEQAGAVIAALDPRGAWVEPGRLRHHDAEPPGGVIDSATFARNVRLLSRFLAAGE